MIGIYKITSPKNRIYIGQSCNIEKRFKQYLQLSNCKYQPKLYRSFLKHNINNHNFEIIEECEINQLNIRERFWQDYYNVLNGGLNCLLTNIINQSGKISDYTRLKMSNSAKKKPKVSDETKLKMAESKKGIKQSEEQIKNRVEFNKKIILDIQTGIFYNGIKEASIAKNVSYYYLIDALNVKRNRKNKTSLIYV